MRREIEQAVRTDRVIVPVHTPNFDFDDFDRFLPAELGGEVRRFNGQELPQQWFKYAVQRLVEEFLVPIDIATTAVPDADRAVVAEIRETAESASAVSEVHLSAQEYFERAYARAEDDLDAKIADYDEAIRLNRETLSCF